MQTFAHQGRYYDQPSEIWFEWWSEFSDLKLETIIHMRATRFEKTTLITAVFSDQDPMTHGKVTYVREAMAQAECQLNTGAAAPVENIRGVLRHLVQMARAVAA